MKRYIYNPFQAYFYIQNGVLPIKPPEVNPSTDRIFYTFTDEETKEVYQLWCNRKH
ncbi:hypothetical protein HBE96_23125 [Clostridium sp. P21]|uniref:Uncharacterized protein n=1 Tax=Clostridium muellerianum TaxID=2716538 RepID=A0A7Y0HPV7_9CLOT|nr:hypothetical protein [Clostridium muellerianum]NMM65474.1 hypothetical protein [Clostridium muellerianum]